MKTGARKQMGERPALFWEAGPGDTVECRLCPHGCRLKAGHRGRCRVRMNSEGELVTLNYGRVTSLALDPVEKKPLYHFYPGTTILSVGTMGCNLTCRFCQNWRLSQGQAPYTPMSPVELVDRAAALGGEDCIGIAFTYNEPLVWYEFVIDSCRESYDRGLKNVLVTNGFVQSEPWRRLLSLVHAVNIDMKGLDAEFYREVCGGSPDEVMESVETAFEMGVHLEVTNLLIPGRNDSPEEVSQLAGWLASLSPDIPLHLSRYFPNYQLTLPPTPVETLQRARQEALRHLRHVYVGNLWTSEGTDTICYNCGQVLIERNGLKAEILGLSGGVCGTCGQEIAVRDSRSDGSQY